jgi:HlyD family secretion protein
MQQRTWVWGAIGLVILVMIVGVVFTRGRAPAASPNPPEANIVRQGPSQDRQSPGARQSPVRGGRQAPVPAVTVDRPRQTTLTVTLAPSASIVSLRQAQIVSKVAGYLEAVNVRPGDMVRAGQVVAVVDHAQLDNQVAQAQAAVDASRAAVATAQASAGASKAQVLNAQAATRRAEADLANAQASLVRTRAQATTAQAANQRAAQLFRDGLIAQAAADDARSVAEQAQAAVVAAEAQVRSVEASVQQSVAQLAVARANEAAAVAQVRTQQAQVANLMVGVRTARISRDNAIIRAPWSGIVVTRTLDPGAYVTPGTSSAILVVADLSQVAAVVNIPEAQMGGVRKGNTATISVDAFPGRSFTGTVARIAGGVEPDTRTVKTEIDIPNAEGLLRPGMFARMSLSAGSKQALVVPLSAITVAGNQSFVWIVREERVSRRQVTAGQTTAQVVEITAGLTVQDTIVVRGTEMVAEGGRVRAVPATR